MSQLVESQRTFPFRRRLFVARHKKRNIWLRLWKPLAKAGLVVGVPAVLGLWVLTAPQFTLQTVHVDGIDQVAGMWINQRLAIFHGRPLVSMPMSAVEDRLSAHPWIATVEVHKRLPNSLQVEIQEKVPWAVVRSAEGADLVDEEGRRFAPFLDDSRWANLPVIEGATEPLVLARAVHVVEELTVVQPVWGDEVSRIEVLNDWDFRIQTQALPFAVIVNSQAVRSTASGLSKYLAQIQKQFPQIQSVDLRVNGSIVVLPGTQQEE